MFFSVVRARRFLGPLLEPLHSQPSSLDVAPGVVKRVVVALCTNRGALLVGEPGTAKSWLSELITAAVSGDSSLIIQGGAVNQISQLLYSWNEAIVRDRGPCPEALVPSPMLRGM